MSKKILFVLGTMVRAGAQRVVSVLANDYAASDWSVHIALLIDNKVEYSLNDSIEIHDISHKGNRLKNFSKWVNELKQVINEVKPDVIVSFAGRINVITLLANRGTCIPVLVSERNDPARDRRSSFEMWLCKKLYQKADRVVFQTKYQSEFYSKWCKDNSVIIGNPISAPVYEGAHESKDIICVGKLMDQKNHPMMIRAFSKIASEFADTQVYIYGEGRKRAELEQLIADSGMSSSIHLMGNSPEIFSIMQKNEYFVMCSDYEGLSNALLEAMMSGMVCITTSWSGVEEFVTDGVNGYLVPVNDSDALAAKLNEVLRCDNSNVRANAIATAKYYSSDKVLADWRAAIEGIIKNG